MKKLLFIVLLPASAHSMDPSWQKFISDAWNSLHPMAKQAVFDLGLKAAGEIDRNIRQAAYNRSYARQVKSQQEALEKAQQNQQKAETNQLIAASLLSEEEKTGQEFDRCLNDNFGCRDLTGLGIPRRCNSPARRLTLYNAAAVEARIALFKQRKAQGGAAQ